MTRHFLLLLMVSTFLFGHLSFSQSAYFDNQIYKDATSIPGNVTYHLKLDFKGISIPLVYLTINPSTNQTYYGDSIPNIADDNSGSSGLIFTSYAINASNFLDTVGRLNCVPKSKNLFFIHKAANTPGLCDGELSYMVDTTGHHIPGNNFAALKFNNDGSSSFFLNNIGLNNFDTLCESKYYFGAFNFSAGMNFTELHTFLLGLNLMPIPSTLSISINPYATSNGPICNGKANVSVTGGHPPYSFSFDNGAFTASDSVVGLCAGIHLLTIADTQDTVARNYIINDASNTFNNTNPFGPVADTIIINHADCSFDYNTLVDSAFIDNYTFINASTLFISFKIWQAGNFTIITDTVIYPFQNNSTYMISLVLYCGNQRLAIANTFSGIRVNDYVHASNLVTAIKDVTINDLSIVYPNPFSKDLTIKSSNNISTIKMTDVIGNDVSIDIERYQDQYKLSTEKLSKGIYFITVTYDHKQTSVFKVIKQ